MDKIDFRGWFGLERETLRVGKNGRLAKSAHPFSEDCFSRDFAENQLEIVTPVCNSTDELLSVLEKLDKQAREVLAAKEETLWLNSNPPYFESEDEIPIANYIGENVSKKEYREYLAAKYGKRLMLYCGIHFNFSFAENISTEEYFKIFKYLNLYSYILVLLTSASPVFDRSLVGKQGICVDRYASRRNSKKGYWNNFIPVLDYADINAYVKSVNKYIKNGKLYSVAELYMPVRIKPENPGGSISEICKTGINHIELRMFDVNPMTKLGISKEDLDFAHYMILYFAHKPDFEYTPLMQYKAIKRHKSAAKFNTSKSIIKKTTKLLRDMREYFKEYKEVCENIDFQLDKIINNKRYCDIIKRDQPLT